MQEITGTFKEVQVGDVMVRGTVTRVAEPVRTRGGRMLMVIEFDTRIGGHADTWVVSPDSSGKWQRPE